MAKLEILGYIFAIAIMIILGLAVSQMGAKGTEVAKNAVQVTEISSIKNASLSWVGQNPMDYAMNGYCSLSVDAIAPYIPNLKVVSNGGSNVLQSNTSDSIGIWYKVGCDATNGNKLKIIASVADEVKANIYNNIKKSLDPQGLTTYETTNTSASGVLTLVYNQ